MGQAASGGPLHHAEQAPRVCNDPDTAGSPGRGYCGLSHAEGEKTMKKLVIALTALSLLGGAATPSIAASACRDKSGKFVKCPAKAAPAKASKPTQCRDSKGHFTKCK
jgi:hypothetical protein